MRSGQGEPQLLLPARLSKVPCMAWVAEFLALHSNLMFAHVYAHTCLGTSSISNVQRSNMPARLYCADPDSTATRLAALAAACTSARTLLPCKHMARQQSAASTRSSTGVATGSAHTAAAQVLPQVVLTQLLRLLPPCCSWRCTTSPSPESGSWRRWPTSPQSPSGTRTAG
jgi:hypothetical protein